MAARSFLDKTGLTYYDSKVEDRLDELVESVTYSGHTVTVSLRGGTSSTFDTADTTYSEASSSAAGLMSTDHFDALDSIDTALTQAEVDALFT